MIVVACTVAIMLSCKDQNQGITPEVQSELSSTSIKIEDDRVKFTNLAEMNSLLKKTKKLSPKQLNELTGDKFLSYYELQQKDKQLVDKAREATKNETDLKDTPILDSYLASLLNKNREIEVGNDTIYKIGNDYCFYYHKSDVSLVETFYKDLAGSKVSIAPIPGELKLNYGKKLGVYGTVIESVPVQFSDKKESSKSARVAGGGELYFRSDRRMVGKFYTAGYLLYATIGIQTLMQRKSTGWFSSGWTSENATFLTTQIFGGSYSLRFTNGFPLTLPVTPSYQEERNTDEAYIRVDWFAGPLPRFLWNNATGQHSVVYETRLLTLNTFY